MENSTVMIQTILVYGLFLAGGFVLYKFLPRLLTNANFYAPKVIQDRLDNGDELVIIDVRTAEEFEGEQGHIKGAINMPVLQMKQELEDKKDSLQTYQDQEILVVCETEKRAPHATRMLAQVGLKNVSVLRGGMTAWREAGLPLDGSPAFKKAKREQEKVEKLSRIKNKG